MLMLPPSVRVFVAAEPADMRRSFDTLAVLVEQVIRQDPYSGHLFVFRNRTGDRMKILYWDRSGFCLWYKRLEEGVFRLPTGKGASVELDTSELAMILEGIDPESAKREKRYARPRTDATPSG
jgi:transposase